MRRQSYSTRCCKPWPKNLPHQFWRLSSPGEAERPLPQRALRFIGFSVNTVPLNDRSPSLLLEKHTATSVRQARNSLKRLPTPYARRITVPPRHHQGIRKRQVKAGDLKGWRGPVSAARWVALRLQMRTISRCACFHPIMYRPSEST